MTSQLFKKVHKFGSFQCKEWRKVLKAAMAAAYNLDLKKWIAFDQLWPNARQLKGVGITHATGAKYTQMYEKAWKKTKNAIIPKPYLTYYSPP